MLNKKKDYIYLNYFLVLFLIALSGIPFFSGVEFFEIILFIISFVMFTLKGLKKDFQVFLIVFLFLLIEVFQHLLHGGYSYRTSAGTMIKLLVAYFVIKLVKDEFTTYYINILYVFTIISILFYVLSFVPNVTDYFINNITPYFESPFKDPNAFYKASPNIIIFTFERTLITDFRNSGPFWEPGGFAVFLILAILFNIIKTGKLFNRKGILFTIALITTFSTAGYIALFVVISGYYAFNKKVSYKLMLGVFVLASISIYTSISFLNQKVEHNMEIADQTTSSRFGSALADIKLFKESPVIGWGRGAMRYGKEKFAFFGQAEHRNNGIFILLATYGILGSLIYYYFMFKSFLSLCAFSKFHKKFAIVLFITVLVLGFSQALFLKPFFFSLLFLFVAYKPKAHNPRLIKL